MFGELNGVYATLPRRWLCLAVKLCQTLLQPHGLVAHRVPLSMGFSRQEYWSRLPFPSPGDLPDLRIELSSPACISCSAGRFFTTEPPGKPNA